MLIVLFIVVIVSFHALPIADWLIRALHKAAMAMTAVAQAFEAMVKNYRYMRANFGKELVND